MIDAIIAWDMEDDPRGSVQHIADNGITMEEVEEVLLDERNPVGESRSKRFQAQKPSLQDLIASGDVTQVLSMGEYWELRKTFAALKHLREQQGLSVSEVADRTGVDRAMISRLENGHVENPTIGTMSRYANALGKRVVVSLVDACAS
jgi:DNA-binding XRE family transcriptional regulator